MDEMHYVQQYLQETGETQPACRAWPLQIMVRETGVEPITFGSGSSTTPRPRRTKLNLANNFPVVNPDIRHLFWFLFWFKGEFIPKSVRRFTPKDMETRRFRPWR
jgi:hypothetical protein